MSPGSSTGVKLSHLLRLKSTILSNLSINLSSQMDLIENTIFLFSLMNLHILKLLLNLTAPLILPLPPTSSTYMNANATSTSLGILKQWNVSHSARLTLQFLPIHKIKWSASVKLVQSGIQFSISVLLIAKIPDMQLVSG